MKKTDVKYRYALNENNKLIEIHEAHQVGGEYNCPQCGKKMICKCGSKNAWHFAHNKAECDYNKYLHTIAEQRISDWFNSSNEISIIMRTNEICDKSDSCKFYREECRREVDSDKFNLKEYYGYCEKEKTFEKNGQRFIADLLCLPKNEKNEPLFIEICVTHPCEQEKIDSGIRIIEFVIKSEEDIDSIIGKQIRASNKIRLYNFHPKDKYSSSITFESLLEKFIVYKSKKGYKEPIHCSKLYNRRGIIEISILYNGYHPEFMGDGGLFSIAFAVASQYDKSIKHCCLCKYHDYDMWDGNGICKMYKYGTNRDSIDNDAQQCPYFRIDEQSIQLRIKEFDDYCRDNPFDIWIKNK